MYIIPYLHVHPDLPSCTSCCTFMYTMLYLHVFPALPSCISCPIFTYILPYLHVHYALSCSCASCPIFMKYILPYSHVVHHILTYLNVYYALSSCTSCATFMYILPYLHQLRFHSVQHTQNAQFTYSVNEVLL